MAENNVILQVQDVTMQFGGLRAIRQRQLPC